MPTRNHVTPVDFYLDDRAEADRRIFYATEDAEATAFASGAARAAAVVGPSPIHPSFAYGCVDWYQYPDSQANSLRDAIAPA